MADKPKLVRVQVPDRFETFEDHQGAVYGKGDIVEVTEATAQAHGLAAVKEQLTEEALSAHSPVGQEQKDAENVRAIQATAEAAKRGVKGKELERIGEAAKSAARPAPPNKKPKATDEE